jgi:hypothetical protein
MPPRWTAKCNAQTTPFRGIHAGPCSTTHGGEHNLSLAIGFEGPASPAVDVFCSLRRASPCALSVSHQTCLQSRCDDSLRSFPSSFCYTPRTAPGDAGIRQVMSEPSPTRPLLTASAQYTPRNRGPITTLFDQPKSCLATPTLGAQQHTFYFGHQGKFNYFDPSCFPTGTISSEQLQSAYWGLYYCSPHLRPSFV